MNSGVHPRVQLINRGSLLRTQLKRPPFEATVIITGNTFHPHRDRVVKTIRKRHTLASLAPKVKNPFICSVNGSWKWRKDWETIRVSHGDIVHFVLLMQGGGGGGGGGGKNPLATVAMVALAVFATPLAAGMVGASTGFAFFAAKAGILLAGSMLINAALGGSRPSTQPSTLQAQALAAPSPVYNLNAQGNTARLGQAIPVGYGRHIFYPDFAAEPYTEYSGNEQLLYQLMCIGQGSYSIESIRIEDTAIGAFSDVTYQVVEPGGTVTLFPTDVVTSIEVSGQELPGNLAYIGPYTINASGTTTNRLGFDVVFPSGLFFANDQGGLSNHTAQFLFEYRLIDNAGAPLGLWQPQSTITVTAATNTPIRQSYYYDVAAGRYEVRARRVNNKNTGSRYGDTVLWDGARAYLPGTQNYGNVTMLAIRMRASNQLSNTAARRINVIATRKLPIWNGTVWSAPTATRSIAWAVADICRSEYGPELADARIDLAALLALDTVWSGRGDTFDGVFDNTITFWEALTSVARVGRARPYIQGGIVRLARDAQVAVPTALFNYRNILPSSFEAEYLLPGAETPDAVEAEFFNKDTWKPDRVIAIPPGGTSNRPATVRYFGIVDRNHAHREGIYEAAANKWRRRPMKFATEMEGFIPSLLDLVAIARDRSSYGQTAEIVSWNAGTKTAVLSEPMVWGAGQHYVGLRKRDGTFDGPHAVTQGADTKTIVFAVNPSFTPDTGSTRERTSVAFGLGEAYRMLARVTGIRPRGLHHVEISCINEDDRVHTADGTAAPAPTVGWNLPAVVSKPVVANLKIVQGGTPTDPVLFVSWRPAVSASHYLVEQSTDGAYWVPVGQPAVSSITIKPMLGTNHIRVAGVGVLVGDWIDTQVEYGENVYPSSPTVALPSPSGLELFNSAGDTIFEGRDAKFVWRQQSPTGGQEVGSEPHGGGDGYIDNWFSHFEVQILKTDGTMLRTERAYDPTYTYTYEKNYEDNLGVPLREFVIKVYQRGFRNERSAVPAQLSVSNPQPALPTAVSLRASFKNIFLQHTPPTDTDYDGLIVWRSTTPGFVPSALNLVYQGKDTTIVLDADPSTTYYIKYASFDGFGVSGVTMSGEISIVTESIGPVDLADLAVTTPKIADLAVVLGKMAADSVDSSKLVTAAVTEIKIATDAVTAAKIAVSAVTETKIATDAVTTPKLVANAVTAAKIGASEVIAGKIAADAVTANEIATNAVTTIKINALAITTAKIAADAVTANELATGSVTTLKLAAGAVTAEKITAGTITANEIAANTITAAKIAAGTITGNEIAASTITAAKLSVSQLSAIAADLGTITAGTITLDTSGHIKSGQTDYATGSGFFLGRHGGEAAFSIGDADNYARYKPSAGLQLRVSSFQIDLAAVFSSLIANRWETVSGIGAQTLNGVCFATNINKWLAVGASTGVGARYLLSYALPGDEWSSGVTGKAFDLNDVVWDGTTAVAVGAADGTDAYIVSGAPSGSTWSPTERTNAKNITLNGVCYSPSLDLFCAVGAADGTDAYILTSPDGTTWTERANPLNITLNHVCWSAKDSRFVAVGMNTGGANTTPYIATSPDGITWTQRTLNAGLSGNTWDLYGVAASSTCVIACGTKGIGGPIIVRSTDGGVNWSEVGPNYAGTIAAPLRKPVWTGSLFAVPAPGHILTSTDGSSWVIRYRYQRGTGTADTTNASRCIGWSGYNFVAVGAGPSVFNSVVVS